VFCNADVPSSVLSEQPPTPGPQGPFLPVASFLHLPCCAVSHRTNAVQKQVSCYYVLNDRENNEESRLVHSGLKYPVSGGGQKLEERFPRIFYSESSKWACETDDTYKPVQIHNLCVWKVSEGRYCLNAAILPSSFPQDWFWHQPPAQVLILLAL
jgi:hypothetical protein